MASEGAVGAAAVARSASLRGRRSFSIRHGNDAQRRLYRLSPKDFERRVSICDTDVRFDNDCMSEVSWCELEISLFPTAKCRFVCALQHVIG